MTVVDVVLILRQSRDLGSWSLYTRERFMCSVTQPEPGLQVSYLHREHSLPPSRSGLAAAPQGEGGCCRQASLGDAFLRTSEQLKYLTGDWNSSSAARSSAEALLLSTNVFWLLRSKLEAIWLGLSFMVLCTVISWWRSLFTAICRAWDLPYWCLF